MQPERLAAKYIELRERLAVLAKEEKEIKAMQEKIEDYFRLNVLGPETQNITYSGVATVFKKKKESASIADRAIVEEYAIKHNRLDLFQSRLNLSAVQELMVPTKNGYSEPPPPGINFTTEIKIIFNKK